MEEKLIHNAVLIYKTHGVSVETSEEVYKFVFQTNEGICSKEVKENQYRKADIGDSGALKTVGNKVLSFGKWIQEEKWDTLEWLKN